MELEGNLLRFFVDDIAGISPDKDRCLTDIGFSVSWVVRKSGLGVR